MFWLSSAPGAFNVSYVASKLIMGMAHLSEIRPPCNPCATLPPSSTDARVFPDRRGKGEAGVQTTTGPVVISKEGMLIDLGGSLMAARAYRHCLVTEIPNWGEVSTYSHWWTCSCCFQLICDGWWTCTGVHDIKNCIPCFYCTVTSFAKHFWHS